MDSTLSRTPTNQDGFLYRHSRETDCVSSNSSSTFLNIQPIYQKTPQEFDQTSEFSISAVQPGNQSFCDDTERQTINWDKLDFSCPSDMFGRAGNERSILIENQNVSCAGRMEFKFTSQNYPEDGLRAEEVSNIRTVSSQTHSENHQFERVLNQKNMSADIQNSLSINEEYCHNNSNKGNETTIDQSNLPYSDIVTNANLEASMLTYAEPPFQSGTFESWRSMDSPQDIPSHMNFNPSSIEESLSSTSIKNQVLSKDLGDINCMDFKEINIELDVNNQSTAQDLNLSDNNHVSFYEVSKLLQNNSDLSSNFFDNTWLQSGNFHSFNGHPSLYNYISGMYLDTERYGFINQPPGSDALISSDLSSPMYDAGHNEHMMQQMPLYSNCDGLNGHIDFHNGTGDGKLAPTTMNRDSYQMQHLRLMDEASYVKTDYQQETFQATSFLSSLCYKDEKELDQRVYHALETSKQGRISSQASDCSVDTSVMSNEKDINNSSLCDGSQFSENFLSTNCDKSMYNTVYDFAPDYYYKDFLNGSHGDLKNRSRGRGIKRSRQRSGRLPGRSSSRTDQISYDYMMQKESASNYSTSGNLQQSAQSDGDINQMDWNSKGNDVVLGEKFNFISKIKLPNKHNTSQFLFDTSKRPSNVNEAICKYMDYLILENECKTCISSCSTGVQLPYVGFEKERYFHEVMCQPISFPTAKFRDWLKLFDMDIEITDVDGLTASQTTFLPPLSQNNFISPVIGLNENKINLNGVGKPKDDLIIHSSRRSEIAIRSRGRPRKSWSSFSRYSEKDKSTCFDNSQFTSECKTVFPTSTSSQNPCWLINKEPWQNKGVLPGSGLSYNINQGRAVSTGFLSSPLISTTGIQSDFRFSTNSNSVLSPGDSKVSIRPPVRPYGNSIQVLKKGKNENIVIKVITPPKLQYKLNYEKLNGGKTNVTNNIDNIDSVGQKQPDSSFDGNMTSRVAKNEGFGVNNSQNNTPVGMASDGDSDEGRDFVPNTKVSCNLSLECCTETESAQDLSDKCDTVQGVDNAVARKGETVDENISQCLDVGSNLEVHAEESEHLGGGALKKRGRPRTYSPISSSSSSQVIIRKSKHHEAANKMIKLDI